MPNSDALQKMMLLKSTKSQQRSLCNSELVETGSFQAPAQEVSVLTEAAKSYCYLINLNKKIHTKNKTEHP